jgi:hypothetical protein
MSQPVRLRINATVDAVAATGRCFLGPLLLFVASAYRRRHVARPLTTLITT